MGFDPIAWILEDELADPDAGEVSAGPAPQVLRSAAISMPGVFLSQVAALRALRLQGLDSAEHAPVAVIGHSQGLLAARAAEEVAKVKREPLEDVMFRLSTNACRLFHLAWT